MLCVFFLKDGRIVEQKHASSFLDERYERTMNNLLPALKIAYRAYLFDNSGLQTIQLGEKVTDGTAVGFEVSAD